MHCTILCMFLSISLFCACDGKNMVAHGADPLEGRTHARVLPPPLKITSLPADSVKPKRSGAEPVVPSLKIVPLPVSRTPGVLATSVHSVRSDQPWRLSAPSQKILPNTSSLHVWALETGLDVKKRQIIGASRRFSLTSAPQIVAWVKVKNTGPPTQITMVWFQHKKERFRYTLKVGTSTRWRTWSKRRFFSEDVGRWVVDVRDLSGRTLASAKFFVQPQAF